MLVCFDVDGVLVDVSQSYHQALVDTVSSLLPNLSSRIEREALLRLKCLLNLNNDWDAALAGILFYLSGRPFEDFVRALSEGPPDFRKFYRWAERERIELPPYAFLVEIFEDFYRRRRSREKLNISLSGLAEIRSMARVLAVITGRTKEDLDYTFEKYSLYQFFDFILTEDDLPSVECRKPSPYALQQLFLKSGPCFPACYVGDTLSDSQMVSNFNRQENQRVHFILFRNALNAEVQADFYVSDENGLRQILKNLKEEFKAHP
jgi:HAD superfamily phosphatase